jgi:hypothetical protein
MRDRPIVGTCVQAWSRASRSLVPSAKLQHTTVPFILTLLRPSGVAQFRCARGGVLLLLAVSATCVFVAAWVMPGTYSWRANAISESAAQGVEFAWVARLGFLAFGWAVIWLALHLRRIWARGAYWMFLAFGAFMLATAAFSHKPWLAGVAFDRFEDFLHSVSATGMGFAFALGVTARCLQRGDDAWSSKVRDCIPVIAAVALPLLGQLWPSVMGMLQRAMFAVAYLWFASEALATRKPQGSP